MTAHSATRYALAYWYLEKNFSYVTCTSILKPRMEPEDYIAGQLVAAKSMGKLYPCVLIKLAGKTGF